MASFVNFANNFISGNGDWNSLPRMIQDCIRVHAQLIDCTEYVQLQSPMLKVCGGSVYSPQDIYSGIQFFRELGIHSFVFMEDSTYALRFLHDLFSFPDQFGWDFSLSVSQGYDKVLTDRWNTKKEIYGVVVKITERKRGKSLPSDVIS